MILGLKFALSLGRVRGTQPGTFPCRHGRSIGSLHMVLYSLSLFIRHCLQFFTDNCLLEVDKGRGLERFLWGLGLALLLATGGGFQGGSLCVGRKGRFGVDRRGGFRVDRRGGFRAFNKKGYKTGNSGRIPRLE